MIDNAAEQDLDDYEDGVGAEPEPEIEAEDDDDLGEWADAEEATPGILHRESEVQSEAVAQAVPVTDAEMPMPAQVSKPKRPALKPNQPKRNAKAPKRGAKKAKQKKSAKKR